MIITVYAKQNRKSFKTTVTNFFQFSRIRFYFHSFSLISAKLFMAPRINFFHVIFGFFFSIPFWHDLNRKIKKKVFISQGTGKLYSYKASKFNFFLEFTLEMYFKSLIFEFKILQT